jgi:pimeloyl-ACP methyl ester carboxylesterase
VAESWEDAWTPTAYAQNGAVRIAYDRLIGSDGDPLLLIMGLGVSRFWWPTGLARAFAGERFEVARYDQRDAGQSTRMPGTGPRNPFVFGASLGGVIAQRVALRHPDRVLTVTSAAALPSDVSGLGAGRYVRFGLLARLARAKHPAGREGDIAAALAVARGVASPAYPFDEDAAREWIEREVDAGPRDTGAQARQAGASWHGPRLRDLKQPTLVLHGDQDPILRVSAARATARAIAGSRLVILPGVGHDLPAPLWPTIARDVRALADQAVVSGAE